MEGIVHGYIAVSAVQDQLEKQQEARRPSSGRRASAFHARGSSLSRGSHYRHPTPSGMPTTHPTDGTVGATQYRCDAPNTLPPTTRRHSASDSRPQPKTHEASSDSTRARSERPSPTITPTPFSAAATAT